MEWKDQLDKLREELSVRAIAREISAARVPYTVKVLAYRNGEGRLKPGELVVGSSVPGVSGTVIESVVFCFGESIPVCLTQNSSKHEAFLLF